MSVIDATPQELACRMNGMIACPDPACDQCVHIGGLSTVRLEESQKTLTIGFWCEAGHCWRWQFDQHSGMVGLVVSKLPDQLTEDLWLDDEEERR